MSQDCCSLTKGSAYLWDPNHISFNSESVQMATRSIWFHVYTLRVEGFIWFLGWGTPGTPTRTPGTPTRTPGGPRNLLPWTTLYTTASPPRIRRGVSRPTRTRRSGVMPVFGLKSVLFRSFPAEAAAEHRDRAAHHSVHHRLAATHP